MIFGWLKGQRPPRIGPLSARDASVLARIHGESFARPWDAHDIERMLSDAAIVADGIFGGKSHRPEGFALSRQVLDEGEILTIAVASRRQGQGYGRALLAGHLARLAANGVRTLFLEVEEANRPAIALYRRFGFNEAGRREGYYQEPGKARAALVMRRTL